MLVNMHLTRFCYLVLFFNCRNIDKLLRIENDVVHDGDKCMVIVLVIMHVVESRASLCTGFGLVLCALV